jgi:hypothetical protein
MGRRARGGTRREKGEGKGAVTKRRLPVFPARFYKGGACAHKGHIHFCSGEGDWGSNVYGGGSTWIGRGILTKHDAATVVTHGREPTRRRTAGVCRPRVATRCSFGRKSARGRCRKPSLVRGWRRPKGRAAKCTLGIFFGVIGLEAFGGKLGVARTWPEGVVGRIVGGKEGVQNGWWIVAWGANLEGALGVHGDGSNGEGSGRTGQNCYSRKRTSGWSVGASHSAFLMSP